eukprot:scaffold1928_cov109-Alexandrium_tamarense.AAC.1
MLVTQENMSSLKYSIKLFANKGLTRFTGESVTIAKKQLIVACTRLSDVGQLPQDTLKDVLTGLKEGCHVRKCSKPKDKQRIARNREKYLKEKESGGGSQGSTGGTGKNYQRQSFSAPKEGNGVAYVDGRLQCFCKHGCNWNVSHTSNFHKKWLVSQSTFRLPSTHPFQKALNVNAPFASPSTPTSASSVSWSASAVPTAASANAAGSAIDRDKIAAAYGRVESSTLNADTAAVIGILKEALLN